MDKKIYFRGGSKSFDIAETISSAEVWYEWVERSKNMMRRMKLSKRVLLWICNILHMATQAGGNVFKKWKKRDHLSQFFCAQKFNEYGRFINIVAVQGQRRSTIILPENNFNDGWGEIATKIASFINRGDQVVRRSPDFQEDIVPDLTASFVEINGLTSTIDNVPCPTLLDEEEEPESVLPYPLGSP